MGLQRRKEWLKENKSRINDLLPAKASLKVDLKKQLRPIYLGLMEKVGNDRIKEFTTELSHTKAKEVGVSLTFQVSDPNVKKWLGKRLEATSDSIAKTTLKGIQEVLRDDYENGESLSTMSQHIKGFFDEEEKYRADLIARTESTASVNKADLEGIRQLGIKDRVGKVWLPEHDDRTRETHQAAGERYADGYDKETGEVMGLDDLFEVGDDQMDSPGNGDDAGENVNCRCGMVYEIIRDEE
jgi:hypothetical protein